MRRRFICNTCSGGCELITDSFEDETVINLPDCKISKVQWKELKAEAIPCHVCKSDQTFVGTFNYCENCASITEIPFKDE